MKIAILENNVTERIALADILSAKGISVYSFENGYKLLPIAKQKFDVFITDHKINGLTGLDVSGAVLKRNPRCKVIVYTGFETQLLREQYRLIGVHCIVQKPNLDALIREVQNSINLYNRNVWRRMIKSLILLRKILTNFK